MIMTTIARCDEFRNFNLGFGLGPVVTIILVSSITSNRVLFPVFFAHKDFTFDGQVLKLVQCFLQFSKGMRSKHYVDYRMKG
jgi:hypothetical protein